MQTTEKPWYLIQADKISRMNWQINSAEKLKAVIEENVASKSQIMLDVSLPGSFETVGLQLGSLAEKQGAILLMPINKRIEELNQELRNLMLEGDPNQK